MGSLIPLPDLLGSEGADAVQAKGKDHPVFAAETDVECKVLRGDGAALPGVSDGRGRADQRTVAGKRTLLEIEK